MRFLVQLIARASKTQRISLLNYQMLWGVCLIGRSDNCGLREPLVVAKATTPEIGSSTSASSHWAFAPQPSAGTQATMGMTAPARNVCRHPGKGGEAFAFCPAVELHRPLLSEVGCDQAADVMQCLRDVPFGRKGGAPRYLYTLFRGFDTGDFAAGLGAVHGHDIIHARR